MLRFIVRPMPASVLFLTVVFGLSACGPRVTNRNIDALNAQMDAGRALSIKEVEAILGQPTRHTSQLIEQQTTRELPVVRYYYEENGKTVELHFVDNKLQNRIPHFGEKPPTEAPLQMKPKSAK
ncbi:MAG: hypothetical protein K8R23_17860 [Chthoniobacter sp.]|nr:hypothetical protein [Chthoniobacter sp.]